MKVLLTGAAGQLGQALIASKPAGLELIACGRGELDLADADACRVAVQAQRPDWVLNAGAPGALAEALAETGGRLLQVSTDFVFNGEQGRPYQPDQALDPLGVYGASKAAGEAAALALPGARVLRTSWVYGPVGKNFCLTMLRLHALKAAEGEALGVVADQVGCPTATHTLAVACWRAIGAGADSADPNGPRILHWSDAGAASWYDFAVAIGELGLLERAARVVPITTADYSTPARRPSYSLLDCTTSRAALGLEPHHWRAALAQVLDPG